MSSVKERPLRVERDGGNCAAVAQPDGDPGPDCFPVVFVDRRGNDKSIDRYRGESNADFSAYHELEVCETCEKYCKPVLTEHHRVPYRPSWEAFFCYRCDFDARVRVLVEDELGDLETATRFVHRMIAFEFPGDGIRRVTVSR